MTRDVTRFVPQLMYAESNACIQYTPKNERITD